MNQSTSGIAQCNPLSHYVSVHSGARCCLGVGVGVGVGLRLGLGLGLGLGDVCVDEEM